MNAPSPPHGEPGQEVAELCQKLIELNLVKLAGDEDVAWQFDIEAVGVADGLSAYAPLPAIYLASAYAQLWIERCEQNGVDPLVAWQLRDDPNSHS